MKRWKVNFFEFGVFDTGPIKLLEFNFNGIKPV